MSASPLIRAGLAAGIAEQTRLEVVCSVPSVFEITLPAIKAVDVILLEADRIDAANQARLLGLLADADCGCVLLLSDDDVSFESDERMRWLGRGCSLLPRTADWPQIEAAAYAAAAGLVSSSRAQAAELLGRLSTVTAARPERVGQGSTALAADAGMSAHMDPLTPREREVLGQMVEGLANREIAQRLQISTHTAKFHVAQIIAKLHASSRAHAVAKAVRAGLVTMA